MKKLLIGFIFLLIAIGLGYAIQKDPGYLFIYYRQWSLTTSVWAALIAVVIFLIILYYVIKLTRHFFSIPGNVSQWSTKRKYSRALSDIDKGLCHVLSSDWKAALSTFKKSIHNSPNPLVNAYFSIISSHQSGDYSEREKTIQKAINLSSAYKVPMQLLKTQFQIENDELDEVLPTLEHLYQREPKNPVLLLQLKDVLLRLQKWDRLLSLLPKISKYTSLNKKNIDYLYETIYIASLKNISLEETKEDVEKYWHDIPPSFQKRPHVFQAYVTQLIVHRENDKASQLIEHFLNKNWQSDLIETYGEFSTDNNSSRIVNAEKWLAKHPEEPKLLLCLGRLCIQEKIWLKAEEYLKLSLNLLPLKETLIELALVAELTGKQQDAINHLKKSHKISTL